MTPESIAALLVPFLGGEALSPEQLEQLAAYLDLLLRWNARTNLTAVRDADNIVSRHIGESLFAARQLLPRSASSAVEQSARQNDNPRSERAALADGAAAAGSSAAASATTAFDLGSGAGFPGVPLKIWAPEAHVTLIESRNKKATFLKEVARALRLPRLDVFDGRAERIGRAADLVTMRAVERFETSLPIAARLVARGGRLALLIGEAQADSARNLARHLRWSDPVAIPLSRARVLLTGTNPVEHESDQ